jgi:hypothetical protein
MKRSRSARREMCRRKSFIIFFGQSCCEYILSIFHPLSSSHLYAEPTFRIPPRSTTIPPTAHTQKHNAHQHLRCQPPSTTQQIIPHPLTSATNLYTHVAYPISSPIHFAISLPSIVLYPPPISSSSTPVPSSRLSLSAHTAICSYLTTPVHSCFNIISTSNLYTYVSRALALSEGRVGGVTHVVDNDRHNAAFLMLVMSLYEAGISGLGLVINFDSVDANA